jgi:hypothetical protein
MCLEFIKKLLFGTSPKADSTEMETIKKGYSKAVEDFEVDTHLEIQVNEVYSDDEEEKKRKMFAPARDEGQEEEGPAKGGAGNFKKDALPTPPVREERETVKKVDKTLGKNKKMKDKRDKTEVKYTSLTKLRTGRGRGDWRGQLGHRC